MAKQPRDHRAASTSTFDFQRLEVELLRGEHPLPDPKSHPWNDVFNRRRRPAPSYKGELDHIRWLALDPDIEDYIEATLRRRLILILALDIELLLTRQQTAAVNRPSKMNQGRNTQPFETPNPEAATALAVFRLEHDQIVQTSETLSRAGTDPSEFQMNAIRDLGEQYTELARNIGLHAIAEGRMTQAAMARAYGVRPATVNSWVNEARNKNKDK